jgi:hypothetical protein
MKISNYHLSKFIIDFVQNANQDTNWDEWFRILLRIYNHRVPENLIKALISCDIPELTQYCETEMTKIESRRLYHQQQQEKAKEKHEKWIQRRDEGNKRQTKLHQV